MSLRLKLTIPISPLPTYSKKMDLKNYSRVLINWEIVDRDLTLNIVGQRKNREKEFLRGKSFQLLKADLEGQR